MTVSNEIKQHLIELSRLEIKALESLKGVYGTPYVDGNLFANLELRGLAMKQNEQYYSTSLGRLTLLEQNKIEG